jgi:iron complex outermembrane receptor protein
MLDFDSRSRVHSPINWSRDDWRVNLFGVRYGSVPNPEQTGRIPAHVVWNANAGKNSPTGCA